MRHTNLRRLLALALAVVMVLGLGVTGVQAAPAQSLSYEQLDSINTTLMNTGAVLEENQDEAAYAETDMVRVMIVLEGDGAASEMLHSELTFVENAAALARRAELQARQEKLAADISAQVLKGEKLDVVWNLTLMANAMSANVPYGMMDEIAQMEGVSQVYIETQYMPLNDADTSNIVAGEMTGANVANNTFGYTGAGTRIAVIDTGTDTDHQSFSAEGFAYSLARNAAAKGMSEEDYIVSLNLMEQSDIEAVLTQLNVYARNSSLTAEDLYLSSKLPFIYNYVDGNLDVTHDNDDQGSHGSHVAGIAAANAYIPADNIYDFDADGDFDVNDAQVLMDYVVGVSDKAQGLENADLSGDGVVTDYDVHMVLDALDNGGFAEAASSVGVVGVAPDAQIITMKVFGASGGAYASDYMAATEDAVILGCDTVNLSLGAGSPGFISAHEATEAETAYINGLMEQLEQTGIVMYVAAGNSGNWADSDDAYNLMYTDEAGSQTTSEPATYTNALSVASADNVGLVTDRKTWFEGADGSELELVLETVSAGVNEDWITLDPQAEGTTFEAVFIGDPSQLLSGGEQTDLTIYGGSVEDFVDVEGKIVLVARGNMVNFADKHANGALAGAAGVIIYNNVTDPIYASIEGSTATIPCGTITLEQAQQVYELFGGTEGTFCVKHGLNVNEGEGKSAAMSEFSSWGTTGSLTIKPEITAPGGSIYSINGVDENGDAYELMSGTSMASPHSAGLGALAAQYIRENGLEEQTGLSQRVLSQSLMMSTAEPVIDTATGLPYSVRNQGAGLANIENMILADAYVLVEGQEDGKVKAELGDGTAERTFTFTLNNLTDAEQTYALSALTMTTGTTVIEGWSLSTDEMVKLDADVTFSTGETVTVPANGSASVTVTLSVSSETAAQMAYQGYDNGFYIEGFVYATAVADAEGNLAASHSIPMLGWYGNWSDASMYDSNGYLDYAYNTLERPSHIDSYSKNILSWCPIGYGSGMYYSGNIYGSFDTNTGAAIGDSRYLEARNAVNSTDAAQWQLYAIFPTLIRNAADYKLTITDAETGEVYYFNDYEDMEYDDVMVASFYYASYGQWYDTTTDNPVDLESWAFTDLEGNPLPEGTKFTIELACAPDYYLQEDGTVDWSQVSEGAYLRHSFTVDNTKPQLAEDGLVLEGDTLTYTVSDNNYIAAVILLTGDVSSAVNYSFPDMDEDQKGQTVTGTLDLSGYQERYGNKAAIAVCDYAGNESYYAINLGGDGESYGDLVAFQHDLDGYPGSWVAFSEGVEMNESRLFGNDVNFVAAEYVNGHIYAQDESGNLYGIRYEDMLANTVELEKSFITKLNNIYQDFAYSYYDGKLYGLVTYESNGYPTAEVHTINLRGAYYDEDLWADVAAYQEDWAAQRGGLYGLAMAIDDTGSVYVLGPNYDSATETVGTTAHLWKASMATSFGSVYLGAFADLGDTGMGMDYLQSMTWDHNTESLYWAQFYPVSWLKMETNLVKIDPTNASCEVVGQLSSETSGLMAPLTAESAAKTEHANVPEFDATVVAAPTLTQHNLTLGVGNVQTLSVTYDPWYSNDKNVIWTSSDESVAVVDQNGTVTAVGDGACAITVTAVSDETKYDVCEITVASLTLDINGIVSRTEGGLNSVFGAKLYNYSMDKGAAAMTEGELITAPEEFSGFGLNIAAAVEARGSIWACEFGNSGMIYQINKDTGVIEDMLMPIDGDMMFGMSYSGVTDQFTGIMNYFLYVDLPMDHEMEEDIMGSYDGELNQYTWHKFDLSEYLQESDSGYNTGENGQGSIVDIVLCGITTVDNTDGTSYYLTGDFAGKGYQESSYTPTTTHVVLDNVGRLWSIDETVGMTLQTDDYGNRSYVKGESYINPDTYGVFAQAYDDGTYSVFVIREVRETMLTEMYEAGTMPRITYHFSDICYAGKTDSGAPMYFLSMYDYWNSGTTNQLYLFIPGVGTGEYEWDENWNRVEIMTPDSLYDLGTTGFGNIIASITSAQVLDGLPAASAESAAAQPLTAGVFRRTAN